MNRTVTIVGKVICFVLIICLLVKARGSREGDSLALVALANANGGLGWDQATSIDTWSGITMANDRVTIIYIGNKNAGTIPAEIGDLDKLDEFIANNNLVAELPVEIGTCVELTALNFEGNQLTTLPAEIGNLDKLISLTLSTNFISTLPTEIGDLSKIMMLYLMDNDLSSIPPEMANLSTLTTLELNENQLHFDDIELMNSVESFYYSPQNTIGAASTDSLVPGLKIGVVVRGSVNHYAWTKDGDSTGEDSDSISVTETGVYVCTITSDSITDLSLTHQPITVVTPNPIIVENNKISHSYFLVVPNPYNNITTIRYRLSAFSNVELAVYDIAGKRVITLVSELQTSGNYRYEWDANGIAGGMYFIQLNTSDCTHVKRLILFK